MMWRYDVYQSIIIAYEMSQTELEVIRTSGWTRRDSEHRIAHVASVFQTTVADDIKEELKKWEKTVTVETNNLMKVTVIQRKHHNSPSIMDFSKQISF